MSLFLAVLALIVPNLLAAQVVVEASAGTTTHDGVAADVGSGNVMLGIRADTPTWVYATAGIPLDGEAVPWGAAGIGSTMTGSVGIADLGVSWSAHGHLYRLPELSARGTGATVTLLPTAGVSSSTARLELYSGITLYRESFSQAGNDHSLTRTWHDSGARVDLSASPGLVAGVGVRLLRGEGDEYPYGEARLAYTRAGAVAWGSVGAWRIAEASNAGWDLGLSVPLGSDFALFGMASHQPADPIYWNRPRSTWTAGISRAFGSGAAGSPLPVAPLAADGAVVIRLPAAAVESPPFLAGDFSGWQRIPMSLEGDEWVARVSVGSGHYHYSFVTADGEWFVPDSFPTVDDGLGGESAVLVVP